MALSKLPILGPIRAQLVDAARREVDALVGPQVEGFLGSYSAAAAESAVSYLLAEDNSPKLRAARRQLASKLLNRPLCKLVAPTAREITRDRPRSPEITRDRKLAAHG